MADVSLRYLAPEVEMEAFPEELAGKPFPFVVPSAEGLATVEARLRVLNRLRALNGAGYLIMEITWSAPDAP